MKFSAEYDTKSNVASIVLRSESESDCVKLADMLSMLQASNGHFYTTQINTGVVA